MLICDLDSILDALKQYLRKLQILEAHKFHTLYEFDHIRVQIKILDAVEEYSKFFIGKLYKYVLWDQY